MKTLREEFESIDYKYYNDIKDIDYTNFIECECINFIESYFNIGGKQFLINDSINSFSNNSSGYRATHSVSAFVLSVIFFEKYKERIQQFQQPVNNNKIHLFVLFLTFLYHDFYHYMENDGSMEQISNIESELIALDIKGLDFPYDTASIKKYFEYRNKNEHGIYAGYKLKKSLKDKLDNVQKGYDPASEGQLYWSVDDIPYHDLASSSIIKHNIWLANSDSADEEQKVRVKHYIDKGLNSFIIDNKGRIKFKENPLLYIFFIIDTIEPIKILHKAGMKSNNNDTYGDLLINIKIRVNKDSIRLMYNGNYKCIGCYSFCEAKKMESWMKVTVSQKCSANSITLIIKF